MSGKNPRLEGLAREAEIGDGIDRLSHLPDHILLHILSFLDTRDTVQTSALSTRWRSVWKHVPHLNFERDSFPSFKLFRGFLHQVLGSLSNDSRIRYKDDDDLTELDRVVECAAEESHCSTRHIRIESGTETLPFLDLDCPFWDCDVASLELREVSFHGVEDWVGFRRLTSLKLGECEVYSLGNGGFDFFAQFTCLKKLLVSGCGFFHAMKCFKVSGPQLVSLEIHVMNLRKAPVCVVAPELKFFSFIFDSGVSEFSQLSLPLLDHAEIGFKSAPSFAEGTKGRVTAKFVKLFQGLQNVTSLKLDCHTITAIREIRYGLEDQPCPFTQLKCLKVPRSEEPYTIPDRLINYFLKGSYSTNPGSLQFV